MDCETVEIVFDGIEHDTGAATLFILDGEKWWIPNSLWEPISSCEIEVARWFAEKEELI